MLRNQLEFYFSDENLLHGKFFQKLIIRDNHKGVPNTVIENLNKVKQILNDVQDSSKRIDFIKEAIGFSSILKLNKKKNKIKRKQDFNLDKIDERIIYVEYLPNNINHDLLISIISRCGKVVPRFNSQVF